MDKGKILEVIGLSVEFPTRQGVVQAAKDVCFELHSGRTLGIVGESGSGKSVSALSVMRLLPAGKCSLSGQILLWDGSGGAPLPLHQLPEPEMQQIRGWRIGMIFQEPMSSLNPVFRCGDQITESLRLHLKLDARAAAERALEWFDKVQLSDPNRIFKSFPHQLSGGQKQRVMIAMALCCQPDLLIADEPTTALDVTVQKAILDLIRELQDNTGAACLFISHDLGVISELAHEVAVMHQGAMVETGPVEEVFRHPKHPYTKGLIACRPPLYKRLHRLPVVADFLSPDAATPEAIVAAPRIIDQTTPLLDVRHVSVRYPGRPPVQALSEASFVLYPGETMGIVGESGSGKTTLGRALLRLEDAQSGEAWYQGQNLLALSEASLRSIRRDIQMIFQDPYSALNPRYPIGRAILEPMQWHGICGNAAEGKGQTIELLRTVGLGPEYFDRYPHELSGGQRQRACIARALSVRPRLLICDESVSALDVSVQAQVLNLLQDLRDAQGLSMIFISHDISVIRQISDRVLVMKDGRIVESGSTDDVCSHPQSDYTRQLMDAVPGRRAGW